MALAAANKDGKYQKVVGTAADFLKKLQWDDGEDKKPADDFFGGAGYDSKSRPDLSNTQFFVDALAAAGSTKTTDDPLDGTKDALPGYGSMTYAGVKSLIYAGVDKKDARVVAALKWLRKNYSVDANPGMPPQLKSRGLYYYYHTMSKTLDLLGEDEFADDAGTKHDWRTDLFRALEAKQDKDGSWKNPTDRWMEGDPALVTGYALMALSHCKPK
jgi:squalene-hopene/tetraprenyl-beta-curcumene cyclase